MKMTFKNKYLMALEAMVLDADKKRGIPKEIHLNQNEAAFLFLEIVYLRREIDEGTLKDRAAVLNVIDIVPHTDNFHLRKLLATTGIISPEDLKFAINSWHKGKFSVLYKHHGMRIPLVIKVEKKKDPEEDWNDDQH